MPDAPLSRCIRAALDLVHAEWTSWTVPDHKGAQYAVMAAAVRKIADDYGWSLSNVMVWCDYCAIPQLCLASQQLAIRSLVKCV